MKNSKLATFFLLISAFTISEGQIRAGDGFLKARKKAVLFVLDVSGSMAGGRIGKVRSTLSKVAETYPKDAAMGLVTFSGCDPAKDIKTPVPLAPGAAQAVVAAANGIVPSGSTDIVGGLKAAAAQVARLDKAEWCVKVILLSDGSHNCSKSGSQSDVKGLVKQITGESSCNEVASISIGVHDWDSEIFEEIADADERSDYRSAEDISEAEDMIHEELETFYEKEIGGSWSGDYSGQGPGSNTSHGDRNGNNNKPEENPSNPDPLGLENEKEKEKEGN